MSSVVYDSGPTSNDLLRELKAKHARPLRQKGEDSSAERDREGSQGHRFEDTSSSRSPTQFQSAVEEIDD